MDEERTVHRREFIATTGMATAGLLLVRPESVRGSQANDAIRIGIIGSGGRGTYLSRELLATGKARIVALHDLYDDRLAEASERINKAAAERGLPAIDSSRLYKGWDAYNDLLASEIDAVVITSPPYFHPEHFEAAVAAGKHCWLEKPVATDVHGTKRIERAGERGAGRISMAVGFQSHYAPAYEEMVRRIHAGALGDIVCAQTYYYSGDLGRKPSEGMSAQDARIRNWVFDRVLSGDILVEQNIHVLDIVNWALKAHPISATATGGKRARLDVDTWDHYVVSFTYPNDVHVSFGSTQLKNSYDSKTQRFMGSRGYAEASFGKGGVRIVGEEPWDANVEEGFGPAVPRKIDAFLESIRTGQLQNEIPGGVESTFTAILGRTAAYTKREATWDSVVKSNARWDAKLERPRT